MIGKVKILPTDRRHVARAIEPTWTLVLAACGNRFIAFERWIDYREFLLEKHISTHQGLEWAEQRHIME